MNWQFSSKRRARDAVDASSHLGFVKLHGRSRRINYSELNVRVFELKLILCRKSESFSWFLPFCSVVCFFSEAEERNTWMNQSIKGWWEDISRCHLHKYPAYEDHLKANVSCVTSLFSLKTLIEKSVNDFFCCTFFCCTSSVDHEKPFMIFSLNLSRHVPPLFWRNPYL